MASAKVAAAMQVLLSSDLSNFSNEDVKSLMEHARKDLKSRGVKSSRNSSSRKSHDERADAPFDPTKCHARQHVLATHPGTKSTLFKKTNSLHIGLLNIQCNCKPTDGGNLCKNHSKTDAFSDATRCYKTGELYLGLYNEDKPENPTRDAPPGKKWTTRKYVWLENVGDEHEQSKTEPPDQSSTTSSKAKKSPKQTSGEKYEDFNWKIAVNSGDIKKFKKNRLQLYLIHHGISIRAEENADGKSPLHSAKKLIEIISDHINTEKPQDEQQDQSSQEKNQDHSEDDTPNFSDDENEQENDDDDDDDDEDIDENEHGDTIVVDGVTYDVDDGEFYDSETSQKMGKVDPSKPKGVDFCKSALKIHGQNIALRMENEF